jgi:hypothetical protein
MGLLARCKGAASGRADRQRTSSTLKEHTVRHTTTIKHALAVALGASALAASPALAGPVDRVDPAAGTVFGSIGVDRQVDRVDPAAGAVFGSIAYDEWRGERARDAAPPAERPRGPGHPSQVTPKPAPIVPAARPDAGDDEVWLILGIALAGTGVAVGSGAVVARRSRLRARRVPA